MLDVGRFTGTADQGHGGGKRAGRRRGPAEYIRRQAGSWDQDNVYRREKGSEAA